MSEMIAWQDAFAIGHETIDAQHRELFRLAGAVQQIEDPLGQVKELREILHGLYEYMRFHFNEEENFMRQIGYADLERHQSLHRELIGALNDIMRASTDLMQLELNLSELMNRWLSAHIATEDRRIAEWQNRQADTPAGDGHSPVADEAIGN